MGYKIIFFSNSCCLSNNNINSEVLNIIDSIFYSYDLGYTKSDSESYRYIEKVLGNDSNEFLHIGDTLSSDYIKPLENGWNALYYGDIDNEDVISIKNLAEVLFYLKDNK